MKNSFFSQSLSTAAFASGNFKKCALNCSDSVNWFLSLQYDPHDTCQEFLPIEFSWTRQLRQYKHVMSCFPNTAEGFAPLFIGILQGIAAGIGISNFLRAFFSWCSWSPHPQVQWRRYHVNCLALSSFGFSIALFCIAFRFDASNMWFHISGHTLSGLEVVRFLVSLPADHAYPSRGLAINKMNPVQPVPAPDNSPSSSTFQ